MRKYNMKPNLSKCAFRVGSKKFLGIMVNNRGIEANPSKVQALLNLQSPRTIKDIQKLIRMIAALNRFVSRSTDKCHSFLPSPQNGEKLSLDNRLLRSIPKDQVVLVGHIGFSQTENERRLDDVPICLRACYKWCAHPR